MVERRKWSKPKPEIEGILVTPEMAKVEEALATFPTDAAKLPFGLWERIGAAVWCATGGSAEGLALFDGWSKGWLYYEAEAANKRWATCAQSPPKDMDAGTLFKMVDKTHDRERGLEEATRLDDVAFETAKPELKKATGLSYGALSAERKKRRKRGGAAAAPKPEPPPIEVLAKAAKDIIASEDVLALFVESIKHRLAGEDSTASLLYLCATSRLFPKPMHVVVKGLSAIGKSHLLDCVFGTNDQQAYMPPEDVVFFTTFTEKSLIYLQEDLAHKILRMAEAVGVKDHEMQDYLIREIISNGRIEHLVTVPGGPGELSTTQRVVKEGPIMFATSTTKAKLHDENETRVLSLETDDTEKQTRRVLEKVAEIEGGLSDGAAVDLEPWLAYQRWLTAGERKVVIPFAKVLGKLMNTKALRMRRDFRQLLMAIKAHALLHREHRKRDAQSQIIATIEDDYSVVHGLLADRLAQGIGSKLKPTEARVLDWVKELQLDKPPGEGVKAQAVAKGMKVDLSTVNRRLIKLTTLGYLENLSPGVGRTAHYITSGRPASIEVMPDPDDLAEAWKSSLSSPRPSKTAA